MKTWLLFDPERGRYYETRASHSVRNIQLRDGAEVRHCSVAPRLVTELPNKLHGLWPGYSMNMMARLSKFNVSLTRLHGIVS